MRNENNDIDNLAEARNLFQKAADAYYEDNFNPPPPFEFRSIEKSKKNRSSLNFKRFVVLAATVVFLVGGSLSVGTLIAPAEAYGNWGILHRLVESVVGGLSTDDDPAPNEIVSSRYISVEEKIDEGKELFEFLYVPSYIPEQYEFEELTVDRFGTGAVVSKYVYCSIDGKGEICITQSFLPNDDFEYTSYNSGDVIEFNDRIIRVMESEESVEIYTNYGILVVFGDISTEEMILIAEKMNL